MADDAISGVYDKGRAEMTNIGVSVLTSEEIVREVESRIGPKVQK